MGHDHHHDHDHDHDHHGSSSHGRAFVVGIALNLTFVAVEVVFGLIAHSLALVADAGHNLGDVLGLALAWGATALARVRPSSRRTFGLRRTTIVASAANALILLFVTGGLAWESVQRLLAPVAPQGKVMIVVALAGAVVNALSAALFLRDRSHDLNLRAAFVHLASDAILAVGVAIAGYTILATGWLWLDPAVSLVLALAILAGTWSLMRQSLNLMLDAVPEGIDPQNVRAFLGDLPGVVEVHDLHIWAMSTTETALTAHLVMPSGSQRPNFLSDACRELHARFSIQHATLQIDPQDAPAPCALAPDEIV
ncbi:MAG TPA: cation diffusion facilitator family transporter [Polyangiaceae bacterium]|nr:cation diffusion facilitator family transporter [Polyangiaceae bacterium]